jgi:hypothetical protein
MARDGIGRPCCGIAGGEKTMSARTGGNPPDPPQGIALRTGFFPLDWTLRFTRTTVTIDGHRHELPWGEQFLPLEPGPHQIQVSYRYLRLSAAGTASADVDVPPDQVVQVSYQAPKSVLVAFLPGKLTVEADSQS